MLELAFDDTFVKPFNGALSYKPKVLHAQDFPKRVSMDVYCKV